MSNYSSSKFNKEDDNTSWQKTFQLVPEGSTVLDIGCSNAVFGKRLIKEKACIVDGIEIDEGDIKAAKKILRNVYKINIETDDINIDQKYDIIFMGDVIEHLARPALALSKVRQLLNKSGKLIFSVPNITHMSVRMMLLKGQIEYGKTGLLDETHLHFYNSEELHRVLNEAGFVVTDFDYTINDIPPELLKREFNKIGLDVGPGFEKISQTVNAIAYQFIGVAESGNAPKSQIVDVSPDNIVSNYIEELQKANKENIDRILEHQERINEENKHLKIQIKKLTRDKETILRSTSWKVAQPLRYLRNQISRGKNDK